MILLPWPKKISISDGFYEKTKSTPGNVRYATDPSLPAEGYVLTIDGEGIALAYSTESGKFYGNKTLTQIFDQYPAKVPLMRIEDAPDLELRGVMLDISRNKIPTLQTLKGIVDLLADVKINHLELYVEGFSYEYRTYKHLFAPEDTPLTMSEVQELDSYCKERFIDLVANQNTLGHMGDWLSLPSFRHLREHADGFSIPGFGSAHPSTIYPYCDETRELLEQLTADLLEGYSSPLYNACMDEPFGLGTGQSRFQADEKGVGGVYADHVMTMQRIARKYGKRMLMFGDVVSKHPEIIGRIPKDILLLEWGYEADHPFGERGEALRREGFEYCNCPGTSTWSSILGRTDNMLGNIRSAAIHAVAGEGNGLLLTDWGDGGHWQYLPVSYPAFCWAGALGWNAASAGSIDLAGYLDRYIFRDETQTMGQLLLDAGRYEAFEDYRMMNGTLSSQLLHMGLVPKSELSKRLVSVLETIAVFADPASVSYRNFARRVGDRKTYDYDGMAAYVDSLEHRAQKADLRCGDGRLVLDELVNALAMVRLAAMARRFIETEGGMPGKEKRDILGRLRGALEGIIREHKRLWLARNKQGRLDKSLANFHAMEASIANRLEGCF
jgi:hypothetical protein